MSGADALTVGILRETLPGEHRVALTPPSVPTITSAGLRVLVESGAGGAAGFTDDAYRKRGATVAGSRAEVFGDSKEDV